MDRCFSFWILVRRSIQLAIDLNPINIRAAYHLDSDAQLSMSLFLKLNNAPLRPKSNQHSCESSSL